MEAIREVRVGVAIIITKNRKFLMGQRQGSHGAGTWSVPGGSMEFGESPEETAIREVREEVGLEISPPTIWTVTNDVFPEGKHFVTIWLIARWRKGRPTIMEPEKCSKLGWFTFNKLPEPLFQPCWQHLIEKVGRPAWV